MHVLVNALSVTNISGRHVLLGHLGRLCEWTRGQHRYTILHHRGNRDMVCDLGCNVEWQCCPAPAESWIRRGVWERSRLGSYAATIGADCVFTPAGYSVGGVSVPQIVFCQNPWALVNLPRNPVERLKARFQRWAYRNAVRDAALMVFNSQYMRRAYTENADREPARSIVVYQAVSDETHAAAACAARKERRERIVSVSSMAPHKGVDTLLRAFAKLPPSLSNVELHLVGGWPDANYERSMRTLAASLRVAGKVVFAGHVTREELHRYYAESRVFCLMSRCESFGIPAVEAEAFGTPVVSSNCCAIPEICGTGGMFPEPDDVDGTALALQRLLVDPVAWLEYSKKANQNAQRFRWDVCSRGLLGLFDCVCREKSPV